MFHTLQAFVVSYEYESIWILFNNILNIVPVKMFTFRTKHHVHCTRFFNNIFIGHRYTNPAG
jgi:hypothetical protein